MKIKSIKANVHQIFAEVPLLKNPLRRRIVFCEVETDEGSISLTDLFKGRSQLLVYHFMFGPDYKAGCPSCSMIAGAHIARVAHATAEVSRTRSCFLQVTRSGDEKASKNVCSS